MKIELKSGGLDIISHGQTFLFGKNKDFTINVTAEDGFCFSVVLKFSDDDSGVQKMEQTADENGIMLFCINFKNSGTGLAAPVKIAEIEEKGLYLMFWSFLDGEKGREVRSVRYTLFYGR